MSEAEAAKKKFLGKLEQAKEKAPKDNKALIIYCSDVNFSIIMDSGLGGTVLKEISNYPWKIDNGCPFVRTANRTTSRAK